jgi:hypothetical protein
MFIAMHHSSFENSVGVKCASLRLIAACANEMRHATPTEFVALGRSEFTINITPLAGLVTRTQSATNNDLLWYKIMLLRHAQNVHDESDQEEHHVNSDKNSHCREK